MAELLLDSHDLQAIDRLLAPAVDGTAAMICCLSACCGRSLSCSP